MFNVANAMAAAGAAFAAGVGLHEIRQGLRTFTTSYYLSPGRMNLINVRGTEVFVDYCHNAPGMEVMGTFVEKYADAKAATSEWGKISRIGMVATAGDRRDQDLRDLGAAAAKFFDVIVVREDERLRGRKPGESAALVIEGARAASRPAAPGCVRSRKSSTRSRRFATAWHGRIRATSWCSASTTTPASSPSWSRSPKRRRRGPTSGAVTSTSGDLGAPERPKPPSGVKTRCAWVAGRGSPRNSAQVSQLRTPCKVSAVD
jgi:hypothetical protein